MQKDARMGRCSCSFDAIFHPIARRLLDRCDAVLRAGGPSAGADEMVALARAAGKLVVSEAGALPAGAA
ncbi:MAG: hydrolase [Conexibacter sp.]|nr:hydrolase [Conexibacter sp.]